MASRLLVASSSASLSALTKGVGQLSLGNTCRAVLQGGVRPSLASLSSRTNTTIASAATGSSLSNTSVWSNTCKSGLPLEYDWTQLEQRRGLASKAKKKAKRERKALGLEKTHKKKKDAKKTATPPKASKDNLDDADDELVAPQHEAWVDFQKELSVGGFDTGQVTQARTTKKSSTGYQLRDLKRREKVERKLQAQQQELINVRGGEMPIERFSDEETERLLALAYASIPPRAGKRGTKNLKRQKKRWFLVRKIHKKQKRWRIAAHGRRMEARSRRVRETKEIKDEAPDIRERDRQYQREVLQRWAANLILDDGDNGGGGVIQAEVTENKANA